MKRSELEGIVREIKNDGIAQLMLGMAYNVRAGCDECEGLDTLAGKPLSQHGRWTLISEISRYEGVGILDQNE